MKEKELKRILKVTGAISVEALSTLVVNMGLEFSVVDLGLIESMVEDGHLVASHTKGFILYGLPRAEASLEESIATLRETFEDGEFSQAKAAKALGLRSPEARARLAELEESGHIKHVREGKYMGQPYPIFKVVHD